MSEALVVVVLVRDEEDGGCLCHADRTAGPGYDAHCTVFKSKASSHSDLARLAFDSHLGLCVVNARHIQRRAEHRSLRGRI